MFKRVHFEELAHTTSIYNNQLPFPHIMVDDFWDSVDDIKKAHEEIYQVPIDDFLYNDQHEHQWYKRGLNKIDKMPPTIRKIIETLNSQEALDYFSRLTGIYGLKSDPTLWGGGVHVTSPGGKLGVHSDFNYHPDTGYHRRLNILLYLNPEWKDEWGGSLDLWDEGMTKCYQTIHPRFNRMAMFNTTSESYHGHPDPLASPEAVERISIALYYYTEERPEYEKRDPHDRALWQIRPNTNDSHNYMAENEIIEAQSTIAHSHTQHYNPILTSIEPESNLKTLLDAMAFE
jgi:hypothetical protein